MGRVRFVTAAASLLVAACAGVRSEVPAAGADLGGELFVSAAASLTDAFADMAAAFEAANPEVAVVLNLAGSSTLREQILEGAPVDVFASADVANMDQLVAAGEIAGAPSVFATNELEIAVPGGNPAGITGLPDFSRNELLLGLCREGVPCGDLARTALAKAGVTPSVDTNEPDVRALLTKVAAGELDAGITYVTDVAAAEGSVEGIAIPVDHNVLAAYPIAVLNGAPHPATASAFVAYVRSDEGLEILAGHGFGPP
jgi:molybdate transport system substrate-binding protein